MDLSLKITFLLITQLLVLCLGASDKWPKHDISTLKLLQIVHRHGDRNPISFPPNDPYQDKKYWPEGIAELTAKGKYRMYKLGEYIRNEYNDYLGDKYSPREVYVRSSLSQRCIESVSTLLAGAYPPRHPDWQWAGNGSDAELGRLWQPFPIETFMPKKDDIVLRQDKYCPIVYAQKALIYGSYKIQNFLKNKRDLFDKLSTVVGTEVNSVKVASYIQTALQIEMSRGLYWSHVWTREEQQEIVDQLLDVHRLAYRNDWNNTIIKRLRAGGLVKELIKNMVSVVKNRNDKKLFIYSTHDSMLAALMVALNCFDGDLPLFGSTLFVELHQNSTSEDYFIRIYYLRDTNSNLPESLRLGDCDNKYDCPLNEFLNSTKPLIYENFKKECRNLSDPHNHIDDDRLYFIR